MKKDWLGAIFVFPSAILDELIEATKRIFNDEKEAYEGGEHDPESDEE